MNYDFAEIVKVNGCEVMVKFTIRSEYKDGKKNKKVLTGTDESGAMYTATGINDCNYTLKAHNVIKL